MDAWNGPTLKDLSLKDRIAINQLVSEVTAHLGYNWCRHLTMWPGDGY